MGTDSDYRLNYLVLERCDAQKNEARYYVLQINQTLFGEIALTRAWGRMGTKGREHQAVFTTEAKARTNLELWLKRKQARSYRIASSRFF